MFIIQTRKRDQNICISSFQKTILSWLTKVEQVYVLYTNLISKWHIVCIQGHMRDHLVCFHIRMYTKSWVSFFALYTLASFMDDVHSLSYEIRNVGIVWIRLMKWWIRWWPILSMYVYIEREREMVLEAFELCHQ